jgi:enoyl-CoA hydratase/carnithine racemase
MLAIVRSLSHWRAELQGSPRRLQILTDHKALEYFMTTKQLTSRQARWSELLSQFFFHITYRPGKANELADALSRREQDTGPQDKVKEQLRSKPLLAANQIDPQIRTELDIFAVDSLTLIDTILRQNRGHSSLETLREMPEKATRTSHSKKAYSSGRACLLSQTLTTYGHSLLRSPCTYIVSTP